MAYSQFTFKKRQRLEHLLCLTRNLSEIARRLGVHRSTISRELSRNGDGYRYKAKRAQERAMGRKLRPKGILMVNRRPSWKFIPRYPTYLCKFEKPEKRIFRGKDLSDRMPNFLTEWKKFLRKGRYKTFRRKRATYQNLRTYPRKRYHRYENYLRGPRMWPLVVRYSIRTTKHHYRYTVTSKPINATNKTALPWSSKTRPSFPIGYWRRHLKDFMNRRKEMLQKDVCQKNLALPATNALSKDRQTVERKRKNKTTSGKNKYCLEMRRTRPHDYSKFSSRPLSGGDQHEKLLVENTNIGVTFNSLSCDQQLLRGNLLVKNTNKEGEGGCWATHPIIGVVTNNFLQKLQVTTPATAGQLFRGDLLVKNTNKGAFISAPARTGTGPPGRFFLKKIKAVFRTAFFMPGFSQAKPIFFIFLGYFRFQKSAFHFFDHPVLHLSCWSFFDPVRQQKNLLPGLSQTGGFLFSPKGVCILTG